MGFYTEIDEQKGLENFAGDVDDYREILSMVAETCEMDIEELQGYYDASDIENFIIKVHGMKSQCYYIGGTNIGDMAKSLEFAGKEGRIDFINENIGPFEDNYREFSAAVEAYLNK